MCTGTALLADDLPAELAGRPELPHRLYLRNGTLREYRFLWADRRPLLPVWHGGRLHLALWGNRDRRSRLPCSGLTWQQSLEDGKWGTLQPEKVVVPANLIYANGVWIPVRQGVCGLLVRDERDAPHVYLLCAPPTPYYRVMTQAQAQPVLVGETI